MINFKTGDIVTSKINNIAKVKYEIIKINKTTCWLKTNLYMIEDNKKIYFDKPTIYKNVRYSILNKIG